MAHTERNAEIVKLIADGKTYQEVADELDVSRATVSGVVRRHKSAEEVPTVVKNTTEISREGNTIQAQSSGDRVHSVDELIDVCSVDLGKFQIVKDRIKTWEGFIKTGPKGREYIIAKTLFGITVDFLPKVLEQVGVALNPIEVNIPKARKGRPSSTIKEVHRWVALFDPHFGFSKSLRTGRLDPFHDRGAISVALELIDYLQPEGVALGGDWFDLADWTDRFVRSPSEEYTTQPALLEAGFILGGIRVRVPDACIEMIPGNHEARMDRSVKTQQKESYGLRAIDEMHLPPMLSIPRLLALHTMDIEWKGSYPDGEIEIDENISVEHGAVARAKSGATVGALVQEVTKHTLIGHIHRREQAYKTLRDGSQVSVTCPGCLCRTDEGGPPAKSTRNNWQQGIAVIDFVEGMEPNIQIVPIDNRRAIFEGQVFKGWDYRDELIDATRSKADGEAWPF